MLFNLSTSGHHPSYILHLIRFWGEHDLPGSLNIVVSPKFIQQHTDIVDLARKYGQEKVNLVPITIDETAALLPHSNYLNRKLYFFQEWRLVYSYAESLKADHCLLMYFDTIQIPMAVAKKFPCSVSSIYFRPTFHYNQFDHYKPTWKDSLQQSQEKLILSLALRHRQLKTLFCLDPFVVKYLDKFNTTVKNVYLPDPVQIYNDTAITTKKLRESLNIDPSRKIFLLFGSLDGRKGLHQLLEAVSLLSPDVCQQICLLLVGPIDNSVKSHVDNRVIQISQSLPIQIITHNQFIADHEIQAYFKLADVILAPYQRHVGMSAILVRAATAQKPVLSSNYGLMGEITRRYQLGITVDSTIPHQIALGLAQFVNTSPEKFGDSTKMKTFAEQNTAEKFASVIFQHV
ncbi:glycosyltransferase [Aetokthonos hydrillicola CCALA 1050]|nr:glycosyltransferase [Aetokthonos hydrillicola CCALA 1050]